MANAVERCREVDGDDRVPFVDGKLFDRGDVLYAGVVDEDVDAAELPFGIGDHGLDRLQPAHIGRMVGHRKAVRLPETDA
jgi:hypothetical protein